MAVNMTTSGVHHISLRVSDLERAKSFYCDTLGFKHLMDETLGKNYVAFKDPDRIAWEFYMA
ncbi:MAG: VOC family protein [Gemmatimonadaceae bacterium]